MKKVFVFICASILSVGIASAQENNAKAVPSKPTAKKEAMSSKCDMKNCCMMKAGKMMCIMDGKEMAMEKEMTMKNGMKCMPDGTCMGKDGKKMKMKDGQCCDMSGNMCDMPMHHSAPAKK